MDIRNFTIKCNLFFALLCLHTACRERSEQDIDKLRSEVLMLHDEVMPLMGDLKTLRKEVHKEAERLTKEDSIVNSERIYTLRELSQKMDDAFEGMFVWMRQYQANQEEMSRDEVLNYLNEQKVMVQKVNHEINTSLSTAKTELKKGA